MAQAELPFHRPSFTELERRYLLEALEERYWGGGSWVFRLEAALRAFFGREAVAVSSGTAALHLSLSLLLGEKGGEVIVPVWTFTATASEIIHAGGIPVFADVNEDLLLCADTVEPLISSRTRGIVVVHYGGKPAPMDELLHLCQKHDLWLLEDTCHAVPAYYGGQLCGTFGIAATLSFHATKPIAAGQGGAILFADPLMADKARLLRRHGIRRHSDKPWLYEVEVLGWNYMLSDLQAALALAQIERLHETWQRRAYLAQLYTAGLRDLSLLKLPEEQTPHTHSWHLYPVRWLRASAARRDALLQHLRDRGIHLNVHYKPLHLHPAYRPYIRDNQHFPVAERAWEESFSLPLWTDLPEAVVERLIQELRVALNTVASEAK